MYILNFLDDQVPQDIHKAAYNYLQTCHWHSKFRHVPNSDVMPGTGGYKKDLAPYIVKRTAYLSTFGNDHGSLQNHMPIAVLFDYINNTMFEGKFELAGKALGLRGSPYIQEVEDYEFEKQFAGQLAYMEAQPYESANRTRIPHRDWDISPKDSDRFYTITFIANLTWNPIYHGEVMFYDDADNGIGWVRDFTPNIPGRVILHDARLLHTAKPTSVLSPELAQRISFRVRLKEGETLV